MKAARGRGRGGWQQADLPSAEDAQAWFSGRLPDGWFTGAPGVTCDRDEIVVVGELPALETAHPDTDAGRADAAAARAEARGVTVIMNRCPKIEYGRLSGEIGWTGVNSRILSAKKPVLAGRGVQRLTIAERGKRPD